MRNWMIIGLIIIIGCFVLLVIFKPVDLSKNKLDRNISDKEQLVLNSQTFTKETLTQYDGVDGHKAYIAVNGIVYDVTALKGWKNGEHHGLKAGSDLTAAFMKSNHGNSVLSKLKIVGKYSE